MKNCNIFCVNETEAEVMTGVAPLTLFNAQDALNKLFDMGCNTVIITLGGSGAVFASCDNKNMIHIPVERVIPVDTTVRCNYFSIQVFMLLKYLICLQGAGDAFLGALAYFIAYHPGLPLEEHVTRACQIAAQSVLKTGTQTSFPTKQNLPNELFV